MEEKINWAAFESPYWAPEKDVQYELVLGFWRQEMKSFDDKTEKLVLVFDVLKINNEEYAQGTKQFVTAAASFANDARPIVERAEKQGMKVIHVMLKYSKDKRYSVMDMSTRFPEAKHE